MFNSYVKLPKGIRGGMPASWPILDTLHKMTNS